MKSLAGNFDIKRNSFFIKNSYDVFLPHELEFDGQGAQGTNLYYLRTLALKSLLVSINRPGARAPYLYHLENVFKIRISSSNF